MRGSIACLVLTVALGGPLVAAEPDELVLRDRILAVVDEDPILASDVERIIALGLAEPREEETRGAFRRRVLEGLIEQRLRYQEIDRYSFEQVPVEAIDRQLEAMRERLGGAEELAARLERLGMSERDLRQLLARQIEVMSYVEELLGARVFVGYEEIQRYYETVLVPRLEEEGEPVPPIEEVREQIREVLRQERLNEELAAWTEELRREADVIVLFNRPERPLPPVVSTIE